MYYLCVICVHTTRHAAADLLNLACGVPGENILGSAGVVCVEFDEYSVPVLAAVDTLRDCRDLTTDPGDGGAVGCDGVGLLW